MGRLYDWALGVGGRLNEETHYGHWEDTKNRPISGSKTEGIHEGTMAGLAYVNRNKEVAKYHAERTFESVVKNTLKY